MASRSARRASAGGGVRIRRLILGSIAAISLMSLLPLSAATASQPSPPTGVTGIALDGRVELAWQSDIRRHVLRGLPRKRPRRRSLPASPLQAGSSRRRSPTRRWQTGRRTTTSSTRLRAERNPRTRWSFRPRPPDVRARQATRSSSRTASQARPAGGSSTPAALPMEASRGSPPPRASTGATRSTSRSSREPARRSASRSIGAATTAAPERGSSP